MSSWVVVTGKANAGARRQLGSVQSADIQLIKTKLQQKQEASKHSSIQAGRQAGRQVGKQTGKEMDGCSQQPTDRVPLTKTTASYLLVLFLFNWPDSLQR
jgi:hypothetical protein